MSGLPSIADIARTSLNGSEVPGAVIGARPSQATPVGFQASWDNVIFGHSTIWYISVEMEEKMAIYSIDELSRREI